MNDFYKYQIPQNPFHISVGAVLFNENYEICMHHFFKKNVPEHLHFLIDNMDECYHLMRESLEGNEPLQDAVLRGIKEEFGAVGIVEKYLGAKIDLIKEPDDTDFEKLTIYHAVRLKDLRERTDKEVEGNTKLEWFKPQVVLDIYTNQVSKTDRPELDERIVIERFMQIYGI